MIRNQTYSPFKLMCKIAGYGMLLSLAISCYLFVSSDNATQTAFALVVCVLMLLLSVVVGFYIACRYQIRREALQSKRMARAIHYPLSTEFEVKKIHVDNEVRKYQRINTYA